MVIKKKVLTNGLGGSINKGVIRTKEMGSMLELDVVGRWKKGRRMDIWLFGSPCFWFAKVPCELALRRFTSQVGRRPMAVLFWVGTS